MSDKCKLLNKSDVKQLGFNEKLIDKLLPAPTIKANPWYRNAAPMKLWAESDVLLAMNAHDFKVYQQTKEKRRQSAEKAIATKTRKALELVENTTIRVTQLSEKKLAHNALSSKQDWFYSTGQYERNAWDADDKTISRWIDNYIRHELTTYDKNLKVIFGKVGKCAAYERLQERITKAIKEVYPFYQE